MAGIKINIAGGAQLRKRFEVLKEKAVPEGAKGVVRGAEWIATESREKYCPVDTGALRSSIRVLPPELTPTTAHVRIVAGSIAVDYAVTVHETNLNYRNGKQWKYLETPMKQAKPEVLREVIAALDEAIGRL